MARIGSSRHVVRNRICRFGMNNAADQSRQARLMTELGRDSLEAGRGGTDIDGDEL